MRSKVPDFLDYQAQKHFANLDGLRCLCIAMVLWHHAQPIDRGILQFADRGRLGVDFFFVLSGFLITTLLLREQDQRGRISIRKFYIRRILRIVPVYFFVVTIAAFYYGFFKGNNVFDLLPYYYLFLSNFLVEHIPTLSITWSLSIEEQFYLILPVTILVFPKRLLVSLTLVAISYCTWASIGYSQETAQRLGPIFLALPYQYYAPILIGALLALLMHSKAGYEFLAKPLGHAMAPVGTVLALIAAIQWTPADSLGMPNLLIHGSMALFLEALIIRPVSIVSIPLQAQVVKRIGVISYGIYLYHMIAKDFTVRVFGKLGIENEWLLLLAYSAVSFVVAEISFRTLEAYFKRFRPAD